MPSCGHSDGVSVDNVDDASREREHPGERTESSSKKHAYHQEDSVPADEHGAEVRARRFRDDQARLEALKQRGFGRAG